MTCSRSNMKCDPRQIELRKKIYRHLKKYFNKGEFKLQTPINVPVGTSFTHQLNSGNYTVTVFKEGTQITGVDFMFNSVIFSKRLTETRYKKPVITLTSDGKSTTFETRVFNLSAMPFDVLEHIAKELGVQ